MNEESAYGVWSLVVINSLVFILFAFSFTRPRTTRDWRSLGAFSAFIVALFAEMYGFPLTIYLLAGWLSSRYPGLNLYAHDTGHLWHTLLGMDSHAHNDPLHIFSELVVFSGVILLAASWMVLLRAQRRRMLATTGPYAYIRHPQYAAFILIMLGFLLQWPTIPTLLMFPVLVTMYMRLAHREETEIRTEFGEVYNWYAATTPTFFPRWKTRPQQSTQ